MAAQHDKSAFWCNPREGEFDAAFDVRGTLRETIRAGSIEEARAIAEDMISDEEMELYASDFDDEAA